MIQLIQSTVSSFSPKVFAAYHLNSQKDSDLLKIMLLGLGLFLKKENFAFTESNCPL